MKKFCLFALALTVGLFTVSDANATFLLRRNVVVVNNNVVPVASVPVASGIAFAPAFTGGVVTNGFGVSFVPGFATNSVFLNNGFGGVGFNAGFGFNNFGFNAGFGGGFRGNALRGNGLRGNAVRFRR